MPSMGDDSVCSIWETLCLLSLLFGSEGVSEKPHTLSKEIQVDTAIMEKWTKAPSRPEGIFTTASSYPTTIYPGKVSHGAKRL